MIVRSLGSIVEDNGYTEVVGRLTREKKVRTETGVVGYKKYVLGLAR